MQTESGLGRGLGTAATVVLLLTVCALPWIHGGTIPFARLVLQIGACTAGLCSFAANVRRRDEYGFPAVVFALGILVFVGVIQLLPVHAPMLTQMSHAVQADLRHEFLTENESGLTFRSGSPADTRLILSQLVALMLLAMTAYSQISGPRRIKLSLTVFTANATLFSLLALTQLLQGRLFLIQSSWWTGMGLPFGTFVNPNNAAGWLSMGLASAVGLLMLQFQASHDQRYSGGRRDSGVLSQVMQYFAGLDGAQLVTWIAVVTISCTLVATRSRGAMLVTGLVVVLVLGLRIQRKQLPGAALLVCGLLLASGGLIRFLSIDEITLYELGTLSNPLEALSVRFGHWRESLGVVRDFPIWGAGLGAYRFVTLPYQTQSIDVWFQHADNQYVETLVETGMVGFLAFLMLGIPAAIRALRVLRRSIRGGARPTDDAIATVLIIAVATQGAFAMFDSGVVLPAASSLFIVLVAMLSAAGDTSFARPATGLGRTASLGMQLLLAIGAAAFLNDQVAAQRCYETAIAGRVLLDEPVTVETLAQRDDLLKRTEEQLRQRMDDPDANEIASRLRSDLLRAEFTKGIPGVDEGDVLEEVWPLTRCLAIVRRIDMLESDRALQQHIQSVLAARFRQSGILSHCERVSRRIPVAPLIQRRAARWLAAAERDSSSLILRARFNEPANPSVSLQLGEIALRGDQPAMAEDLFAQAIRTDASVRGNVLSVYSATDQLAGGLTRFGPEDYIAAATAMSKCEADPTLLESLFQRAGKYWTEPQSPPSLKVQKLRSEHLRIQQDVELRTEWLERCVEWSPDDWQMRVSLAISYQQQSLPERSVREWQEVLRIRPGDRSAQRSISALKRQLREGG